MIMKSLVAFTLMMSAAAVAAQTTPQPPLASVVFETTLGRITLEVDAGHAPITAANFLRYVDGRFYDGGFVDRAVRPDNTTRHDVEIQVIQFQINPAREKEAFPAIRLERTSLTGLTHVDGAISMARGGADSATASFFIAIGDQHELDFGGKRNADGQGFAAFGRVVDGMDVVKKIQQAPTQPAGGQGAFGTETLSPTIAVTRAYRQ
jgi:peptidyl-prolyl cis-trans isomerase A (cyclophilin A)